MDPSLIDLPESANVDKPDIVDSEYQFGENEQQNLAIKTVTCVVAVLGAICVFTLLYIGIRLLSNDSMGSSPSSKLNRSDDSGHHMITNVATGNEGKVVMMEPKYYIAAGNAPPNTVYQPLSMVSSSSSSSGGAGKCGSDKLSALDYQLLGPELVSKLEKGVRCSREESASGRLLKPMISDNNNCNRNCNTNRIQSVNSNKNKHSTCDCRQTNCLCCSANVKFTNEEWRKKDNRHK